MLHPTLAKPLTGPQLARAEVNVDLLWSSLAPIREGDIVKVVIRHPNVSSNTGDMSTGDMSYYPERSGKFHEDHLVLMCITCTVRTCLFWITVFGLQSFV